MTEPGAGFGVGGIVGLAKRTPRTTWFQPSATLICSADRSSFLPLGRRVV